MHGRFQVRSHEKSLTTIAEMLSRGSHGAPAYPPLKRRYKSTLVIMGWHGGGSLHEIDPIPSQTVTNIHHSSMSWCGERLEFSYGVPEHLFIESYLPHAKGILLREFMGGCTPHEKLKNSCKIKKWAEIGLYVSYRHLDWTNLHEILQRKRCW